jgi:hypothetical protein
MFQVNFGSVCQNRFRTTEDIRGNVKQTEVATSAVSPPFWIGTMSTRCPNYILTNGGDSYVQSFLLPNPN